MKWEKIVLKPRIWWNCIFCDSFCWLFWCWACCRWLGYLDVSCGHVTQVILKLLNNSNMEPQKRHKNTVALPTCIDPLTLDFTDLFGIDVYLSILCYYARMLNGAGTPKTTQLIMYTWIDNHWVFGHGRFQHNSHRILFESLKDFFKFLCESMA